MYFICFAILVSCWVLYFILRSFYGPRVGLRMSVRTARHPQRTLGVAVVVRGRLLSGGGTYVVGWSVRPQKNHLIWAIVLPIRELFMYIESATDLSSRRERKERAGIYIRKEQVIRTAEP